MRRLRHSILSVCVAVWSFGCSSSSGPEPEPAAPTGPNLVVQNLAAPAGVAHNSDVGGSVTFEVVNVGDKDAGAFDVRVSIARDDAGNDAVVLATISGLELAAGESQTLSPSALPVTFDAPVGASRLRVAVDPDNAVGERSDADNVATHAISVSPLSGYLYRFAGTVTAVGVGIPARGEEGLLPHETALYWPMDVTVDAQDRVFVLDWNNHRVLCPDANAKFDVVAGGYFGNADDGVADKVGLNHPTHITVAPNGDLILMAWHNSLIKRVNRDTGYMQTICGIDTDANNRKYNGDEIPAVEAYVDLPVTAVFDAAGNMYFGDQGSMIVRKIDTGGVIHTVAGQPPDSLGAPGSRYYVRYPGYFGDGGPAVDARLNFEFGQSATPSGRICMDSQENIYIADTRNHVVRVIMKSNGYIYTFAGLGPNYRGYTGDNGPATSARLQFPRDVACDSQDNLYIADTGNHCIRMVDASGIIRTVAGTPGVPGNVGTVRAVEGLTARLYLPYGITLDRHDNLWIADQQNDAIRVMYK
jgi:hypothetical protein